MKSKLLALALSVGAITLLAQEAVTEPEYVNQYFVLIDGKIQPLERQSFKAQRQTKRRFVYASNSLSETVAGTQSTVKVSPDAHFVVRMDVGDVDPSTMIFLKQFKVGKDDREIILSSSSANIATGPRSKMADDATVPVTVKKYGTKSFEIIPSQPLPQGEYVFTQMAFGPSPPSEQVYCFSVVPK